MTAGEPKEKIQAFRLEFLAPPAGLEIFGHVYSRKYSRFARLDAMLALGFKTPYFRNLPSKKDTQSFFSVAYRLRLAQRYEQMAVNYVVDRRSTREPTKKPEAIASGFSLAPPAGLEPATS